MSISLHDVIACGGALCDGDLLIPADVEFGLSRNDDNKNDRLIPKVLKIDEPSVCANVCDMVGIKPEHLDAKSVQLDWQNGAPLEMYGFCKSFRKRGKVSLQTYVVRGASNYGYGKRFALCKELMEVVCLHMNQNSGLNLLDALDEESFSKVLDDIVKLVKAPWVQNIANPADIDDETAAFYMALEVLMPRRLGKRLKSCLQSKNTSRRNQWVSYDFAVPSEVVGHLFKKQQLDDAQGGVKCSYHDYREQITKNPDFKKREQRYKQQMLNYRKSAREKGQHTV